MTRIRVSSQQILTTIVTRIVVDKSTDNVKAHSICCFVLFCFFYHNINVKETDFFFSEREVEFELKMALRDTLTCAALSVLLLTTAN